MTFYHDIRLERETRVRRLGLDEILNGHFAMTNGGILRVRSRCVIVIATSIFFARTRPGRGGANTIHKLFARSRAETEDFQMNPSGLF